MTDEERCYYVETLEQIKFRCEEKGYSGEVEALDVAIELMEEAEFVSKRKLKEAISKMEELKKEGNSFAECVDECIKILWEVIT